MKPHLEEAKRMLLLADRDVKAFEILKGDPDAHISIIGFHAQQAIEKLFKAVLFSQRVEFERLHDLVKIGAMVRNQKTNPPVNDDQLRRLNPFAVSFRYDDIDIVSISMNDMNDLIADIRRWAGEQVEQAISKADTEEGAEVP
jgi:HEPN domain-containing protein